MINLEGPGHHFQPLDYSFLIILLLSIDGSHFQVNRLPKDNAATLQDHRFPIFQNIFTKTDRQYTRYRKGGTRSLGRQARSAVDWKCSLVTCNGQGFPKA